MRKGQDQVRRLVAGPGVYICDRCIELSQEVLDLVRRTASRTRVVPVNAVTRFGVLAVSFMMVMYALEQRHPVFILAFAAGCLLSSTYGFLSGAWPFGVVELIWCVVAAQRFRKTAAGAT